MKKLIALCSVFISVLAFTSCGNSDYSADRNGNVDQTTDIKHENITSYPATQTVTEKMNPGDYVNDVVDGVQNAGKDIIDGAGNAVKDVVDGADPNKNEHETHTDRNN